jgi:hypothetical protein
MLMRCVLLVGLLLTACGQTAPSATRGTPAPSPTDISTSTPTPIPSPLAEPTPTSSVPSIETQPSGYTAASGPGYDGVIVPEADAAGFGMSADSYWTPAVADIQSFEQGLVEFLRETSPERSPDLGQRQTTYKRQYAGLIRNSQKLIYASFFCDTFNESWRRQVFVVMDGGDCFFQVIYNLDEEKYEGLMVNGEA